MRHHSLSKYFRIIHLSLLKMFTFFLEYQNILIWKTFTLEGYFCTLHHIWKHSFSFISDCSICWNHVYDIWKLQKCVRILQWIHCESTSGCTKAWCWSKYEALWTKGNRGIQGIHKLWFMGWRGHVLKNEKHTYNFKINNSCLLM